MTDTITVTRVDARGDDLRRAYAHLQAGEFASVPPISWRWAADGDVEHAMLLGIALGMTGDVGEAGKLMAFVAAARPEIVHPVEDLGRLLRGRDREADTLPHAAEAVRLRPDDPRALVLLGGALIFHHRAAEAEPLLRRALSLDRRVHNGQNQFGICMTELGRFDEALAHFREAAALDPGSNIAWTNLGCTLATEGRFDEALSYYRRSIELKPDNPAIRLNHAICLLKAGRTAQGWAEYEWRLRLPGHTELPVERLLPNLDDATRLDGTRVLVTQEEGLGDTLQFMRYLAPLRDRGAAVIAWVPAGLHSLLGRIDGIEVLSGPVETLVFAWHCPFLSLPRVFAATRDAEPTAPYIVVGADRRARMAPHLPPEDGRLRVGLVWGGAPRPENRQAHAVDRRRSMGVAPLAAFASLRGALLVSLQHGPYRAAAGSLPAGVVLHDPMDAVADMEDTAALIDGLDVVVSVDTSLVHLAAGMGKPVILLDRYDNCWRWLHGRDDSPSYPTLRIIRQPRPGDWTTVARRTATLLQVLADAKRDGRPASLHAPISDATA